MLTDRSVVVTGGGSGIGRAAVHRLVKLGCAVTIADRDESAGQAVLEEVSAECAGLCQFVRTDVTSEADVAAMVDAAVKSYGRLDAAINSAGINPVGKALHRLTLEEFDRCNAVNLRAMFLCLKYQITAMMEAGGGAIVAISSVAATNGVLNGSDYCASKAGVNGLVRGAALDYAAANIRVNSIMPGGTWTPMAEKALAAIPSMNDFVQAFPMKRFADATEMAEAAIWLISDSASYITGASIATDGALGIA